MTGAPISGGAVRAAPPAPVERRLANGLRAVVQPMPWTRAVAVELVLPAGSARDPEDGPGSAALLWEWLDRGAGGRSARERQEAFASLGIRYGGASGRDRSGFSASLLADVLPQALSLLAAEVSDPTLDEDELDTARTHALEDLASLEDRPAERLGEALNAHAFRGPYARSAYGSEEGLRRLTTEELRRYRAATLLPGGSMLAVAGGVEVESAFAAIGDAFGGWDGAAEASRGASAEPPLPEWAPPGRHDLPLDAQQAQLGWAWPLLPPHDDRAPAQGLGLAVLSGGMGARLFREVREVRGLAYAVSASARGVRGAAWGTAYAGTTPDRAEETIAVVTSELSRLRNGVDGDELERARTGLRTREATEGESSAGRAGQLVQDLVLLDRARSASERLSELARPDLAAVLAALAAAPEVAPTVVTLGPGAGRG